LFCACRVAKELLFRNVCDNLDNRAELIAAASLLLFSDMSEALMQNGQGSVLTANLLSRLDSEDPLSHFRDRFILPENGVYLDGEKCDCFGTAVVLLAATRRYN